MERFARIRIMEKMDINYFVFCEIVLHSLDKRKRWAEYGISTLYRYS